MRKFLVTSLCALFAIPLSAQLIKIPVSKTVSNALEHERGPAISGDGRTMVFMREDSRKKEWNLYITRKNGSKWGAPVEIELLNKSTKLNYVGGYALSFDGSELYYSSVKYGGVGNWDIWRADLTGGGNISTPENLAMPVNSDQSDLCPSLSADGNYLFFVRQNGLLKNTELVEGTIMVAERRGNSWGEPEALPSNVTNGQDMAPKILSDGVTLLFSSKRAGGKGGYDLYMTQKVEGKWTDPKPWDFINTEGDDIFTAVDAQARGTIHAFQDDADNATEDLFTVKIPDEYKPNPVMLFVGKIVEEGSKKPLKSIIQAVDMDTKELVYTARPEDDGRFFLPMGGKRKYDFSIQVLDKKHAFFAEVIDLKDQEKFDLRKEIIEVPKLVKGKSFVLKTSDFERGSTELTEDSDRDIKRLLLMLRNNPALNIEIGVHTDEVLKDTIRSDADLTELIIDTTYIEVPDTAKIAITDSLGNVTLVPDTVKPEPIMVLKYTYHNDRTPKQAKAYKELLEMKGVPSERIKVKGYGAKKNIASNNTAEGREENRRIEVKVL